jgi:hypothetical protein
LIGVTDPQVIVYRSFKQGDDKWEKVGETEMIKETLNPDFVESIKMEFFFEKHIYLKFEVVDGDQKSQKIVGEMKCRLGEIVGAPKQCFKQPLISGKS